jgi:spore coat polysaccharide biosynthesis predicted glycosyltransferase SpsG
VLAGAAYALISIAYLEARAARDRDGIDPGSVAVVSGGADVGELQSSLLAALRQAVPDATLHVVVGPRGLTPGAAPRLVVHQSPPTLGQVLATCAVYVGAAGGSAVQAGCVGVPAVVIPIVENQIAQATALADAGCAVALPLGAGPANLAEPVRELLADPGLAEAMSAAGRRAIDGRGAERVAQALLELAATRSGS